jgi:hypothetical protein
MAFAGLMVVALLAGGWITVLGPRRAELGTIQLKIARAETRRAEAAKLLGTAEQARTDQRRDAATVRRLAKAVPDDDNVGSLVRQLDAIARAHDIDFRAVKLAGAGSAAPVAQGATDPAANAKGGGGSAGAEGSGDAAGAKAKPAGGDKPPATTLGPVAASVAQPPPGASVGPAGLLTVPFSFTFDGGYIAMQRFLGAIDDLAKHEKGRITVRGRLVTVDGFALSAGREGFPKVQALVSATAYLAPDAAKAAPALGAVAADPMLGAPGAPGAAGAGG